MRFLAAIQALRLPLPQERFLLPPAPLLRRQGGQPKRGTIVNAWKLLTAAVVAWALANSVLAGEGCKNCGSGQPGCCGSSAVVGVCARVCYSGKPMPCISCPSCGGISVCYRPKPMPCISCPPCGGISVCYGCKPMPSLCCPSLKAPCD